MITLYTILKINYEFIFYVNIKVNEKVDLMLHKIYSRDH